MGDYGGFNLLTPELFKQMGGIHLKVTFERNLDPLEFTDKSKVFHSSFVVMGDEKEQTEEIIISKLKQFFEYYEKAKSENPKNKLDD